MSLWRDDPPPAPAALGALAAVTLVAVGSMSRVIEAPTYLWWALPAVAIGAAFAILFGHRSLGLGFGVLVAVWLLTLPVLFAREESIWGLPTAEGLSTVRGLIASGFTTGPGTLPPVEAEPRYLVLIWSAFVFLGFLGASWVVVRRPVGAIITALAIVTFSGSVGEGPGRTAFAGAAVAATVVFFLTEGRQRIARWAAGPIRIPVLFGVPTLAAACAFGVVAPLLIGDGPLIELRSAVRPRVVIIKPLSDIQRQLKVDPPLEVLRVSSDLPTYWRLTGLDAYDGREWVLEARPRPVTDGIVPLPDPPSTGEVLTQRYHLTSLLSPWMPAAYAASSVDSPSGFEVDEGSQTLLLREPSPGLAYTVHSRLPHVAANLPASPGAVSDPAERLFGELARPIVGGNPTPLEAARRLEDHFRAYTYDEDVPGGHSAERLQGFLSERRGYCEQFAATMTLMLRGLGFDARVGVGFLPGAQQGADFFIVSTREAHAWVEVNVPGAGWTIFDPTPGRGEAASVPPEISEELETEPPAAPETTAIPAPTPQREEFPEGVRPPEPAGARGAVLWAALGLFVASTPSTAKLVRRRFRRSGAPADVVLGAYAEMADRARELGWTAIPSETHAEFSRRALGSSGEAAALAELADRTLYGPAGVSPQEAAEAWRALHASLRTFRRRASWWRRATAVFDPRTFLPRDAMRWVRTTLGRPFHRS